MHQKRFLEENLILYRNLELHNKSIALGYITLVLQIYRVEDLEYFNGTKCDFSSLQETIDNLFLELTELERNVLIERYGLNNSHYKTYSEIGKILGISSNSAREKHNLAIRKLIYYPRFARIKKLFF